MTEEARARNPAPAAAEGAVSRVGAVVTPHRAGWSTLAAMPVPEEMLEAVAEFVSAFPEVNHNYEREHRLNLWFVVAAADRTSGSGRCWREIEYRTACRCSTCRSRRRSGSISGSGCHDGRPTPTALWSRPWPRACRWCHDRYAALGAGLGLAEEEVIEWPATPDHERRSSAASAIVVRHHELGCRANAMMVWDVPDAQVAAAGGRLRELPFVTLCYRRPRRPPAWPYNLFCMIHGRDRARVLEPGRGGDPSRPGSTGCRARAVQPSAASSSAAPVTMRRQGACWTTPTAGSSTRSRAAFPIVDRPFAEVAARLGAWSRTR